ncbi:hypothetical protein ACO2Q9_04580 [Variovorax sp. VNK109]
MKRHTQAQKLFSRIQPTYARYDRVNDMQRCDETIVSTRRIFL